MKTITEEDKTNFREFFLTLSLEDLCEIIKIIREIIHLKVFKSKPDEYYTTI